MQNELTPKEIQVINRLGDLLLPGYQDMPAFSDCDCVQNAVDVLNYAPPDDVRQLRSLLGILYYAPDLVLRSLIRHMDDSRGGPKIMGGLMRELSFGLRGLIFSCYFNEKNASGHPSPLSLIGAQINRVSR